MIKRILLGLVYFVVFYIGTLLVMGGYSGARQGWSGSSQRIEYNQQPENYGDSRPYRVVGAALLAGIGTMAGILPGTRRS